MENPIGIQTDEDDKAVTDAAKKAREQELDDIRVILKLPQGERFFRRLLSDGKVFHTTFTGNSHTFFLEGHRNLALRYFHDVAEACPEKVPALVLMPQGVKT